MIADRKGLLRWAPYLTLFALAGPVLAGIIGTVTPAFGLMNADGPSLAAFHALIGWPGLTQAIWLSVSTGLVATALSLGMTLLVVATLMGTRVYGAVQKMLTPLLSVPHAAAALGLAFLLAPSGWIARALSPWATGWTIPPDLLILNDPMGLALTVGLVAKEVPFLLLMTLAALPQTNMQARMMVASSLGYGRTKGFLLAVLPPLYGQLRLPVYAVLAYAMTTVDMAMILGPTLPHTLSAQVVLWMMHPDLANRGAAAAGAVLQLAIVIATLTLWQGGEVAGRRLIQNMATTGQRSVWLDRIAAPVSATTVTVLCAGLIAGLAGLALWSVAGLWQFPHALPDTVSLTTWMRAGPDLARTAMTTVSLALVSTGVALALVLACLEAEHRFGLAPGNRALWLLYLPLIVPQVAFLPGLQNLALAAGVNGTGAAVAAAHLVFVLPYVFLSLAPAFRALDPRIAVQAAALGAQPSRVFWHIRLPLLLRPALTAAAVGLAVSVGQYLPTLMIGGGRIETLTTEAVALSSGGNRRIIGAYGLLQMLLPALGFALALALPAFVFRHRRGLRVTP